MPELPEVEAIKLQLGKYVKDHKILSVKVNNPKTFAGNPNDIIGGKVIGTRRFGKVSVMDLDNGYSILTHVKLNRTIYLSGTELAKSQTAFS